MCYQAYSSRRGFPGAQRHVSLGSQKVYVKTNIKQPHDREPTAQLWMEHTRPCRVACFVLTQSLSLRVFFKTNFCFQMSPFRLRDQGLTAQRGSHQSTLNADLQSTRLEPEQDIVLPTLYLPPTGENREDRQSLAWTLNMTRHFPSLQFNQLRLSRCREHCSDLRPTMLINL